MNDGFNWFVIAVLATGIAAGISIGFISPLAAKVVLVIASITGIVGLYKFIYTPVKGVEDDQD